MQVLSVADTADLNLYRRGKVRDTFQLDDGTLLMIATDRLSAFDVVLPTPILGKGTVLTQMSRWWFGQTAGMMPNHLLPDVEEAIPEVVRSDWLPRSMHVARAQRIDVECVVRGFISGSGWKEYRDKGTLAGESLQEGLRDSSRLPSPRFTPAIKKDDGHDVNISRQELRTLVGQTLADELESASLRLFDFATARCESVGIYLADTKSRIRLRQRDIDIDRRDLHSRLVAILGDLGVEGGRARRLVRQAVRARLRRETRLGQDRSRACTPRRRRARYHGALRRSGASHLRDRPQRDRRRMTYAVEVIVALKPVVNDPQGLVVRDSLHRLGFDGVRGVRVGKHIEVEVDAESEQDARDQVERMCEQLLRNTVIEDSRIASLRVMTESA